MVRPIARKKLRNPKLKVTRKRANKARTKKYTGHPLLREHWDNSLTVSQNYRNLGLVSRLNGVSGGTVKNVIPAHQERPDSDEETSELSEKQLKQTIPQGYGLIERDEEGRVINVVLADDPGDPLDSDFEVDNTPAKKEGARILEQYAAEHDERKERWMSVGERQMLQRYVDKHGNDYDAMFWDKQLNRQQLTKRQLQKKIERYLVEKEKELGSGGR
ncbi:Nucleolar protein 16 [Coemansia guatemalensis]|uniref:Nucleolar protein 16 n=1 Tax=Coemansia guatemalensis TaxID=2761395 RepID=A0A9W8HZA2_9FUNG|nr:Nucleolar protein 16 [Coemansia guatemalensis]